MTLSQLDDALPNGLHDAYLLGLDVDFVAGTALLKVKLLVDTSRGAVLHKDAEIRLSGLAALVVEGPERILNPSTGLGISSFETSAQQYPALTQFPAEVRDMFHSLYVEPPWNGFYSYRGRRSRSSLGASRAVLATQPAGQLILQAMIRRTFDFSAPGIC